VGFAPLFLHAVAAFLACAAARFFASTAWQDKIPPDGARTVHGYVFIVAGKHIAPTSSSDLLLDLAAILHTPLQHVAAQTAELGEARGRAAVKPTDKARSHRSLRARTC